MSNAITLFEEPTSRAQIVATNVRGFAARAGYSQSALGRAVGLAQGAIHARWRGVRPWQLDELDTLASVLGVSVYDLISDGESEGYAKPHRGLTPAGSAARSKGLEPPTF